MKDFMRSLLVSFLGALAAIVITTLAAIVLRVTQEQANWQTIHDILARETDEMRETINAMTGKE